MQKPTNFNYISNIGIKRGDYQDKGSNFLKTGERAMNSNLGKNIFKILGLSGMNTMVYTNNLNNNIINNTNNLSLHIHSGTVVFDGEIDDNDGRLGIRDSVTAVRTNP